MENSFTVTDATDWLPTSLPSFSQLETALRCQVCKDFFTNPVITSCSHTFCSLCIRRCLSAEGKCPACRAGDQASKLRRNWALEEVVNTFVAARPEALRIVTEDKRSREDVRPAKRRRVAEDSDVPDSSSQRQTRSRAKNQAPPTTADIMVLDDEEGDDDYQEVEPDDGLVGCPLCGTRMKEEAVFSHLDRCDGSKVTAPKPRVHAPPPRPQFTQTQERLPELNYSLLGDAQMRKKLKELGIPATGQKVLMSRRHTEWINLWNANCDSSRPKSKRELLHELDVWERAQGGLVAGSFGGIGGGSGGQNAIMKKDFDAEGWKRANRDDFGRLIEEARKKARLKAASTEAKSGDEVNGRTTPNGAAVPANPPPQGEGLNGAVVAARDSGGSPSKKVPMFELPSEPIQDAEAGSMGR